ncbi:immunity 17 family protein, partial [Deinococcus roseus]|uniref:immunity 17 family protein n=1 Tax=Deinococcus roseus TaxID=392414 RepID=UPI001E3251BC
VRPGAPGQSAHPAALLRPCHQNFVLYLGILGGLFTLAASYYNWDWFFNNWRARPFVALVGRTGARIFYALIGVVLLVIGVFWLIIR